MGQRARRPVVQALVAVGLLAAALVGIAISIGWGGVETAFGHLRPSWLAACGATTLLAFPSYLLAYRSLGRFVDGPDPPAPLAALTVLVGFGPFSYGGGFALDKRVLEAVGGDERAALLRVLTLGFLEWALLAPLTWAFAVYCLLEGLRRPDPSLLWPWAIGVPAGALITLLALRGVRPRPGAKGLVGRFATGLDGLRRLIEMSLAPRRSWPAWLGMLLYWVCDIATLFAAGEAVGVSLGPAKLMIAYSTGYFLTRRTLPLGGAGITAVLLTLALNRVGVRLTSAVAVVFLYELFTLLLPALATLPVAHRVWVLVERHRSRAFPRRARPAPGPPAG